MTLALADRIAADVFGLTYREFAEAKPTHYKWRVIAPAAVDTLRQAHAENWSLEKLADYLYCDAQEAGNSLRRFVMSEKVNAGGNAGEKVFILLREWLEPLEPDLRARQGMARDLARLLSSQLQVASEAGESLAGLAGALENPGEDAGESGGRAPSWGPQWKD